MAKYTGEFEYKGTLKRVKTDKVLKTAYYTYELNGRTYHIKSIPWMNRYGHWEARCGDYYTSSNQLWRTVANIDRSEKNRNEKNA